MSANSGFLPARQGVSSLELWRTKLPRSGAAACRLRAFGGVLLFSALFAVPCWGQHPEPSRHRLNEAAREDAERIVLEIGKQTVISAENVRSYSEATPGIVDVRLTRDAQRFVLVGMREGTTTLLLLTRDGDERLVEIEVQPAPGQARGPTGNQVGMEHNVRLDFYFVHLNRSNSMNLGMATPESVTMGSFSSSFDFLTQSFQSATALVENQALLRLDIAQSSGWAKLMRKAAVITENGQQAVLSGGGEVNIPVQGSLTTGIHRIEFGSTIQVLPRYDVSSGRLEIQLAADVSDLTDDRGSGAPGRVTSTLQTVVNLELGQAVVLAGLSSESRQQTKTGVPGLSQIPIVGYLFGSRRSRMESADMVVLIVPSVVEATTNVGRRKIREAFDAFRAYSGGRGPKEKIRKTWTNPTLAGFDEVATEASGGERVQASQPPHDLPDAEFSAVNPWPASREVADEDPSGDSGPGERGVPEVDAHRGGRDDGL